MSPVQASESPVYSRIIQPKEIQRTVTDTESNCDLVQKSVSSKYSSYLHQWAYINTEQNCLLGEAAIDVIIKTGFQTGYIISHPMASRGTATKNTPFCILTPYMSVMGRPIAESNPKTPNLIRCSAPGGQVHRNEQAAL